MGTAGIGLRERLITAIPDSLKHAIAVGIGLLIALIGLEWGGVIVASPGTFVTPGSLHSPPVLLTVCGLVVTSALLSRRAPGAILIGILASTLVGLAFGLVRYQGLAGAPPSILPTLLKLDVFGALSSSMLPVIFVFFFLALFDSVGTLVGVASQAGFMRNGTLPRARQALLADAIGTVIGAGLGTSTVTAYIESATGVAAGGRTGLANVVTAVLFLHCVRLHCILVVERPHGALGGFALAGPSVRGLVRRPTCLVDEMRQERHRAPYDSISH
jgi:adenine/guanine/hypoxanthine permease